MSAKKYITFYITVLHSLTYMSASNYLAIIIIYYYSATMIKIQTHSVTIKDFNIIYHKVFTAVQSGLHADQISY